MNTINLNIKKFAISSLFVGLATIFSIFLIPLTLPFGGKITFFSMMMISMPAYYFGIKIGFVASFAFSLIMMVLDSYIIHPVQVIFDYTIAFGCFGIVAFFRDKHNGLIIGFTVACIIRFISHSISGYIFFKDYAPENWNAIIYVIVYNGSFVFTECVFSLLVMMTGPVKKIIEYYKMQLE